jgi:hypothetical protein
MVTPARDEHRGPARLDRQDGEGTHRAAPSPQQAETMTTETSKPSFRTYLVADVKCYLCGSVSGVVESDRQPMPRGVMYRKAGEDQAAPIVDWRRLRCERCQGPIYLDDADVITRRTEEHNWLEERPRRGRPPKRLVEERRRQQERLDSQAA